VLEVQEVWQILVGSPFGDKRVQKPEKNPKIFRDASHIPVHISEKIRSLNILKSLVSKNLGNSRTNLSN
jgi:hypothetical protein